MAGKTKDMSKIKQLLLLHKQGVSNRKAALLIDIDKETANKYINLAKADELPLDALIAMPDPILEYRFRSGNPAYTDARHEYLCQHLDYYRTQLKLPGVTMKLLWEEYVGDHILDRERYGLTQFRHHLNQLLEDGSRNKPSAILKDLYVPGEKIFFDYAGLQPEYVNIETGEVIRCQCFVACLPCTDYCFVCCVPSQSTEDFVYAISQCMKHLGGVPKIWVPDNLKAAVVKCDRYEPTLNRMLEDMANHYGAVICPARPRHPKDKSQVEGQVKIIYQRIYAALRNRTFYSLRELNDAFQEQMVRHNQRRLTNVPYSREEQFLSLEKEALLPLPETDFEIRSQASLKVNPNGCIFLGKDRHWYSVPYRYVGQQVKVIFTRSTVTVYLNGETIATHIRDTRAGGYTTLAEHMASNCLAIRTLSAESYIKRAYQTNRLLGMVVERLFKQNTQVPEETFYHGCDGLLHLARQTDPDLFSRACRIALDQDQCRYTFISNLIRTKCVCAGSIPESVSPPQHSNIRGKQQFQ